MVQYVNCTCSMLLFELPFFGFSIFGYLCRVMLNMTLYDTLTALVTRVMLNMTLYDTLTVLVTRVMLKMTLYDSFIDNTGNK